VDKRRDFTAADDVKGQLLLPYPRAAAWEPAVKCDALGLSRNEVRTIWRHAHQNRQGGDRGDFSDFVEFATQLDHVITKVRLGPQISEVIMLKTVFDEIQVLISWARLHDLEAKSHADADVLRLVREDRGTMEGGKNAMELHVCAYLKEQQQPSYADVVGHRNCVSSATYRGFETSGTFKIKGLEPEVQYYVYAACVEVPAIESVKNREAEEAYAARAAKREARRLARAEDRRARETALRTAKARSPMVKGGHADGAY
jgi:chemotaxis protein histidine kinase CheA